MIRTLFLFGILFALIVIAVKEPGESGLEAARGLATKATDVATDIGHAVETTPEVAVLLDDQVDANQEPDRVFADQIDGALNDLSKDEKILVDSEPHTEVSQPADSARDDDFNMEATHVSEKFTSWNDFPQVETASVPPVATEELSAVPLSPPVSAPTSVREVVFPGDDFTEVKDYYENASRLLAEME